MSLTWFVCVRLNIMDLLRRSMCLNDTCLTMRENSWNSANFRLSRLGERKYKSLLLRRIFSFFIQLLGRLAWTNFTWMCHLQNPCNILCHVQVKSNLWSIFFNISLFSGENSTVKFLLENGGGVDVNLPSEIDFDSPLHMMVEREWPDSLEILPDLVTKIA